jgi:hypothetical protein
MRGEDDYRGWGIDQYMFASLIDSVRENTYAFLLANSKKKPEEPKPAYRPGNKDEKKSKPNSFGSMAAAVYTAANKEK